MGLLVDGVWKDEWYDTKSSGGHFRSVNEAAFRNWVTVDGSAGVSGEGGFSRRARPLSSICPHSPVPGLIGR